MRAPVVGVCVHGALKPRGPQWPTCTPDGVQTDFRLACATFQPAARRGRAAPGAAKRPPRRRGLKNLVVQLSKNIQKTVGKIKFAGSNLCKPAFENIFFSCAGYLVKIMFCLNQLSLPFKRKGRHYGKAVVKRIGCSDHKGHR